MTNNKNDNHQTLIISEGSRQNGLHDWVAPVNIDFRYFSSELTMLAFIFKFVKLTFWMLGTMLKRFFEANKFRFHITKSI